MSVPEVSDAGKDHGNSMLISGFNNFTIPHGTTGLNHG